MSESDKAGPDIGGQVHLFADGVIEPWVVDGGKWVQRHRWQRTGHGNRLLNCCKRSAVGQVWAGELSVERQMRSRTLVVVNQSLDGQADLSVG